MLAGRPLSGPLVHDSDKAMPRHYRVFGLRVRSDLPLPIAECPAEDDTDLDLVIVHAPSSCPPPPPGSPPVAESRCDCAVHNGAVVSRVHRDTRGTWLWYDHIGTFHIAPGTERVAVYPAESATGDTRALGLVLAGQVLTLILQQRGIPCLHASAVQTVSGAIAFFGPKGRGKSTMAANFLRRGAALLTDDVLPLQQRGGEIHGLPSLPIMKLWHQSVVSTLALADELPTLVANFDKKLLALDGRFPFAEAPLPLRALYVLDRYDPRAAGEAGITIRPLAQREGLLQLVAQTSLRDYLRPTEFATLLPLYRRLLQQAPVRVLRYPDGFEHQEAVHARLLADVQAER